MSMTITEKILAAHCGREKVEPGELINAKIDIALGNDITAPIAIKEFEKGPAQKVDDPEKIVLVPDHFTPNKDILSAEHVKILRNFAKKHAISHFYEMGRVGIEHALLPEEGVVGPGDLIIGADSHTCTYGALGAFATGVGSTDLAASWITGEVWFKVPPSIRLTYHGKLKEWVGGKDLILYTIGKIGVDGACYEGMEFVGETVESLSMDYRLTMANMAIEAGAKNGIFHVDRTTEDYLKGRAQRPYTVYRSDPDANYAEEFDFDCGCIEPQVAFPHLPENSRPVSEAVGISIDQVVIGSCTNGRYSDLLEAARVLKGKKVNKNIRLIVIPATQKIYRQAMKEGLLDIFLDAEAVISTPTCGPCLGGHMGVLAKGERALSTTNRNFVGRMGHPESEIYLSNPAVAAASAVLGRIAHPREVIEN